MSCSRRRSTTAAVLVTVSAALAAPVAAQPPVLDPPQLLVDVLFNLDPPGRVSTNQFGTTTLAGPGFGALSLTAAGTPSPSLRANAAVGPSVTPSIFGRASGVLTYGLAVVGPTGSVPVLIDVAGSAAAFANSGASFAVESRWDLLDGGASLAGDDVRSGQLTGSFSQSFGRTVGVTLAANHVYTVFLLADAQAAATLEGSRVTANAFIDPIFSLGPGADPQRYAFAFSPGIGNVRPTTIPEPRTLALLGVGLVALGSARQTFRRLGRAGVTAGA